MSELSRKHRERQCADPECAWHTEEVELPSPFPDRFKNIFVDDDKRELVAPKLPSLFCGPCGCGTCEDQSEAHAPGDRKKGPPKYLRCRGIENTGAVCCECGWANKIPRCPVVEDLKNVTFKKIEKVPNIQTKMLVPAGGSGA
jgi:hypothetical protein